MFHIDIWIGIWWRNPSGCKMKWLGETSTFYGSCCPRVWAGVRVSQTYVKVLDNRFMCSVEYLDSLCAQSASTGHQARENASTPLNGRRDSHNLISVSRMIETRTHTRATPLGATPKHITPEGRVRERPRRPPRAPSRPSELLSTRILVGSRAW